MESCKVSLEIRSSFRTPLHADTLFGALCWTYRYGYGEERLKEFLGGYDQDQPPLILSDPLPKGFLPKPIFSPLSAVTARELAESFYGIERKRTVLGRMVIKRLRRNDLISQRVFKDLKEGISEKLLLKKALSLDICPKDFDYKRETCGSHLYQCPVLNLEEERRVCPTTLILPRQEAILRSAISRKTGRVKQPGGLFSSEETYYPPGFQVEVYIKYQNITRQQIQELFKHLELWGLGKGKYHGKGKLAFISLTQEKLPESQAPNAFMTLSSYIPRPNDPTAGNYHTLVKYGKLDGHFSSGRIDPSAGHLPFKYPLLMFRRGSTFKISEGQPPRPYYGSLVPAHWHPEIRHYGYAFPLGVRIDEDL